MEQKTKNLSEMLNQHLTTGLLIAAAFIIGMLITEVRYLKKGTTAVAAAPAVDAGAAAAPSSPIEEWTEDQIAKVEEVTDKDWQRGGKNAKITLIEYSDFECPFCQRFTATLDQIMKEYGDKIRVVYRHYPLSFHQYAQKAAEASECAGKLGGNDAFWKFHDLYFSKTLANGTGYPQDKLGELAKEAGVGNTSAFQKCLDDGEFAQKVADQQTAGSNVGIQGTPGTILLTQDGKGGLISGALPFEQVKEVIDRYLQ